MGGICIFNFKWLLHWGNLLYMGTLVLLVMVLFIGKSAGGARRWLLLGPISIQPSELVKLSVIIMLAKYYSQHADTRGFTLRQLFIPFLLTAVPFVLIARQPDLGTAVLVVLIAGSMTLFVRIERRTLLSLMAAVTIMAPLIWISLKGYQKRRILTLLDPNSDPLGAGYHIIQSKIAIGSGMFTGKGFLKGTQNALSFLPEQHTDFIFSVLAEEWGLLGCCIVLLAFLIFVVWCLNIASGCRDSFGAILTVGITAMIFWQVFINVGMVMGLMPVVGVPLPLISYGGSSVLTILLGAGVLMSVSMHQFSVE